MAIAFKCFDYKLEEFVSPEAVKLILRHMPSNLSLRYGVSFEDDNNEALMSRA